jgi:hypothetical protein
MTQLRAIVVSLEEADNGIAEIWCGDELMAVTIPHERQPDPRIDSRPDGLPWLIETTSLARGLAEAAPQLTTYWPRHRGTGRMSTTQRITPPAAPGAHRPVVGQ